MGHTAATGATSGNANFTVHVRTFSATAASGLRRYATYRQATVAAAATNFIFGFIRSYVLLVVSTLLAVVTSSGCRYLVNRRSAWTW